ncbi:hypothetical protein [Lysobacter sp. CA199]|uniref:hypothetical protein n=1 Tax=Lysobacter sp. CA199 TaxID=3455608 RepID=UPI003F8D0C22
MNGILRIAKAIWSTVTGAIADAIEWVGRPGNKLKLVCAVFAFAAAVQSMAAYRAEQETRVVIAERNADKATCAADKADLSAAIAGRDSALTLAAEKLKAEADKAALLAQLNVGLQAEVERRAKEAERSAAAFEREYKRKPPECSAALAAMAAACPTLEGY